MNNTESEKYKIRKRIADLRRQFPARDKLAADRVIADTLSSLPEWVKAKTVCIYVSLPEEVDTKNIINALLSDPYKSVIVPRVRRSGGLKLYKIHSINDLASGSYSILEPRPDCQEIGTGEVDLFITPGVAFDRFGVRLGWGKGYYDTLLKKVKVPRIALAYSFQIVPQLPKMSYDIPVDKVITEKEIILI